MKQKEDIYKIVVSVVMIHIMLLFVFEGFAFASNNPNDTIVLSMFDDAVIDSGAVNEQIADAGLCLEGTATEKECEDRGCIWDNGQCFNAITESSGIDFEFYDVILSVVQIVRYLGKFILFLGSLVFFEFVLSFRLMPLIPWTPLQFIITLTLWMFNSILIYYLWAFVSNWRGQR